MSRSDIYYWKCDRPAAFHGTLSRGTPDQEIENQLREALQKHFSASRVDLAAAAGQGNHLTWKAEINDMAMFIRVENGPERDEHLAVESAMLDRVRAIGVPTPRVFGCDATRSSVPFAWQALEHIEARDLNHWFKQGQLESEQVAFGIGLAVALWQGIKLPGFGPLDEDLDGCHETYPDYFRLRLDHHLAFLVQRGFFSHQQSDEILTEVGIHRELLRLERGCLVHKDLALWNILGTQSEITAFIDFDDAISGDPMDDLSLLACFHDAAFLQRAIAGYQSVRALPPHFRRRFWLHLLRNMIVKAVIRVGAGYFERSDSFFLIGAGSHGGDLRQFTLDRIALALHGLRVDSDLHIL
jgi:aminoglycoside phosphotransferase (APT) family kinase protein